MVANTVVSCVKFGSKFSGPSVICHCSLLSDSLCLLITSSELENTLNDHEQLFREFLVKRNGTNRKRVLTVLLDCSNFPPSTIGVLHAMIEKCLSGVWSDTDGFRDGQVASSF